MFHVKITKSMCLQTFCHSSHVLLLLFPLFIVLLQKVFRVSFRVKFRVGVRVNKCLGLVLGLGLGLYNWILCKMFGDELAS